MSQSSSSSWYIDTPKRVDSDLDSASLHPHCPDDEVRELLYRVRDTNSIPEADASRTYQRGRNISFRYKSDLGDGLNLSVKSLEIINKLFVYDLPDLEDVTERDGIPSFLLSDLDDLAAGIQAVYGSAGLDHPCYNLYPVKITGASLNALIHRSRISAYVTGDAATAIHHHAASGDVINADNPMAPTLDWYPAYDLLLHSAWYDGLQNPDISIRFRPRWSQYPTTGTPATLEWPVIIPDVVFSVRIPLSERLRAARQYHPAWVFSKDDSEVLEVPILIAVYNKAHPRWKGTRGIDGLHKDHLLACMTAALPVHAVLGLKTPMAGLLLDRYYAYPFVGMLEEDSGRPTMHKVILDASDPSYKLDMLKRNLPVMHVFDMISKLRVSAESVQRELAIQAPDTILRPLQWPTKAAVALERRRAIDVSRPAWVVEDRVMNFLLSLESPTTIEQWMRAAQIVLYPNQGVINLPDPVKEWLQVLVTRARYGDAYVSAVVEEAKKRLVQEVYEVIPLALSSYMALPISIPDPPILDESPLIFDLCCSQTLCAQARQLSSMPVNEASTNHWAVLYNSLFSRAVRARTIGLALFYHPQWNVHRSLLEAGPEVNFPRDIDEIRPNCAALICLPHKHVILWQRKCEESALRRLLFDFTVTTDAYDTTGVRHVSMPVLVVEYVVIPDDPIERSRHLAHLSIALRSALALWELHHVNAPVLGLLIDRHLVTVVLAYMDDAKKCVIREVLDYVFDVRDPDQAFKLVQFVKALGSPGFESQVLELIDAHAEEARDALFQEDYQSWKDADMPGRDDVLGHTLTDADIPYQKAEGVTGWVTGVPSDDIEQPEDYL